MIKAKQGDENPCKSEAIMGEITEKLVDFVITAKFSDLPHGVVHEAKRVLLDSIGCAIGGLSTDMGRIAVELAKRLGGPCESTIIGTGDMVSCTNAAFANGELINALDFDAMCTGHKTPVVIAGSLALIENAHASGEDLLLAIALGYETAIRLRYAGEDYMAITKEEPDKVKVRRSKVSDTASATIAVAASTGKILNLDREKMANAIGIAGYIFLPNIGNRFFYVSPIRMTKYAVSGWGTQAGVTSALLAQMGFTGDTEVLDGEICFWEYTGHQYWDAKRLLEELGRKWLHKISYKQYPTNMPMAGALDCFIQIIEENDIQPEEIQKITARITPLPQYKHMHQNKLRTPLDFHFNIPYAMACAAHRINPAHWIDQDVRQDQKLREFMQRVEFEIGSDENAFGLAMLADSNASLASAEVVAKGKTFKKKTLHNKGSWEQEFRNTDEELVEKFRENVSRVLPLDKADKVVRAVFELEKLENAAELMKMVAP
ncbi:MmgE/PrpD family protein [Chloroflexota bacterium]